MHAEGEPQQEPIPDPDQAWKALGLVNDWIRHAETKTAAILAATGVTAGLLYNIVSRWEEPCECAILMQVFAGFALLLAGAFCAAGLLPRRKVRGAPEDPSNLLFYSHITRRYGSDGPEYQEVLATLTSNRHEMTNHVAQQIWANSSVADRKFTFANRALMALLAGWALIGAIALLKLAG